jgi:hypothetical protein
MKEKQVAKSESPCKPLWTKEKDNDVIQAARRRQAMREKRNGWITAEGALKTTDNANDLIQALRSGAVECLFVHPLRWWLKPATVPQNIWEGVQFKNGRLWRNGVCLESDHQELVINERQWQQWIAKKDTTVAADAPKAPSKGALRQRRYREKQKASRSVTTGTPPQADHGQGNVEQKRPFNAKTAEAFVRAFLKDNPAVTQTDVRNAGKGRGGRPLLDMAYKKVKEETGEPLKRGPRPKPHAARARGIE